MSYHVLITEPINKAGIELLQQHDCNIRYGTGISESTVLKEAFDCDAILTRNAIISERILSSCPNLKIVSVHGVGVNIVDLDAATRYGIQITNAAKSNQSSVAEYTIGLILSLAKNTILYHRELQAGNWNIRQIPGMDLAGKTLGIIGMGQIGTAVAQKAYYGLDMKVIGYKRNIQTKVETGYGIITPDMEEVIASSDFLSLHLPATSSTQHLIGRKEFSLMKPTAYFINTGRGEVVDEAALTECLTNHWIAGAAIDVYDGGTPNMANPLLHMQNVIVTPHTAAFTSQALERMAYQSALGIVEVLEGKPVTFPVNHPVKYCSV